MIDFLTAYMYFKGWYILFTEAQSLKYISIDLTLLLIIVYFI